MGVVANVVDAVVVAHVDVVVFFNAVVVANVAVAVVIVANVDVVVYLPRMEKYF